MNEAMTDPVRMLNDPAVAEALRGDLACAADVEVTGLDVAGGLVGLEAALAAEAATATGVAAPVAASAMSLGTKTAIAGSVLVGMLGAWIGLQPGDREPTPPSSAKSAGILAERPVLAPPPGLRAQPGRVAPKPVPVVEVVPDEPAIVIDPPTVDEPPMVDEPPRLHKSRSKSAPLSAEDAVAEARLVARAKAALTSAPASALSLANAAKREFPRGMLVEEREALAVQALARLGKTEQAKRRGEAFLRAYGRGPHAASVRAAIEQ